ncbi:mucin-17-like [Penaeus chinensis]|uniref:mucin-17-like n=1 Tax=Penaeus chinensis TaxID=139456 RepID=UPI001FB8489D|nr:mucin-17-like [Penaeus chinensis]
MVNTRRLSKMSVAVYLVMVGAISANWVPYTLGGNTVMVDSSALGHSKPLLIYLQEGMPHRRNSDEVNDNAEAVDTEGSVPDAGAERKTESPSDAPHEDAEPDTQASNLFTNQFGFTKDKNGNLNIDVFPTSQTWDWENQDVLPGTHESLYYAVQTPDASHVSQKIHNIVTTLNQNNAGVKLNDRAPIDAFPIMPARPGDVPPVLSESGFAGVSVMHKVPQDTEPYDESTTNTGNFNLYVNNDPIESATPEGGVYQYEDQIIFEPPAFPSLSSWVNVDHRIKQKDPSVHAATGLQLGSPHAAPLAPSDLHRPGHDSSNAPEQIAEQVSDSLVAVSAADEKQAANTKDESSVTSTTQVSDVSLDVTQLPEVTQDAPTIASATHVTDVREGASPTSDVPSVSQDNGIITEAAIESTSEAQSTVQSEGSVSDISSQQTENDALIEASVANPMQSSAQGQEEATENPENGNDDLGGEVSTIPDVLETTEASSEVNTTIPVDEFLLQKEEELRLKEEQEKQAMLAEQQAHLALELAMADLFTDFTKDEKTNQSESDTDEVEGNPLSITTIERDSSDLLDESDQRADSQLQETQTDIPEIYQTTTESRQSDDQQIIQITRVDEQSTNDQETNADDRVESFVHQPTLEGESDMSQDAREEEQFGTTQEALEKQADDLPVSTQKTIVRESGDIQETQLEDQVVTTQAPQAERQPDDIQKAQLDSSQVTLFDGRPDTSQQTHVEDQLSAYPATLEKEKPGSSEGTLEIRPLPSTDATPLPTLPILYMGNPSLLSDFPPTRDGPTSSQTDLHYSPAAGVDLRPITTDQEDGVYNQRHNPPGPESSLISWYDRDPITIFDPHHHSSKVTGAPEKSGTPSPQDNDIQTGGGGIPGHQPPRLDTNDDDVFLPEEANNTVSLVKNGAVFHAANPSLIEKRTCRCGLRFNTKIVGGDPTDIAQYPWQIGLAQKYDNFVFCGGSIINDRYILTAAHCVDGNYPENLVVRVGETTRSGPAITIDVERITVHEKYSHESIVSYDIALLRLAWPIEFSESVLPVCLPNNNKKFSNKKAVVTGWGKDNSVGNVQERLHEVTVKVLSTKKCRKNSEYDKKEVHKNIVCAASRDKDACQGDSGGPLVVLESDSYTQIGVVSWGIGCAEPDYPGIYTRVSSYMKWIGDNTQEGVMCRGPSVKVKDKNKNKNKNKKNKRKNKNKKQNKDNKENEDEDENNNRKKNKPALAGQILKLTGGETNKRKENRNKNKNKNKNKNENEGGDKEWQSLTQALKGIAEIFREEADDTPTPEPTAEK